MRGVNINGVPGLNYYTNAHARGEHLPPLIDFDGLIRPTPTMTNVTPATNTGRCNGEAVAATCNTAG